MKLRALFLSVFLILPSLAFAETASNESDEDAYYEWASKVWDSLDRQKGKIELPSAIATLNIPEDFYYLSSSDSETVLVDVWGNPPGQNTLGMIFPAGSTPFDNDSWAVTIRYEEDGYVSDSDANDIDYTELLDKMKADVVAESQVRVDQGYEPIELIGWAAPPHYDSQTHKLYWAKEIKFGEDYINTLNYNIRVLGRKGVLVLNFIAAMDQKELIESKLDSVLAMAEFDQGSRYIDFDSSTDQMAAYGLGALVAGKVATKTGLLAAAMVFLKKFGLVIVVGIGAFFKKLFKRKES
ncbi:hypothetical protein BIT28_19470 [Photobacterium proteolyticum]|uniref:DUF2167 domain-containing protein n=1 Tax=Photobacterium proteolyticum TaxID=1903952 RepID=A0A1Q9GHX5_9GAMM|nr:DUF2167 domain-containing protein [Photobacterium proteolyticum]OLQ74066.1 hypothetical protein BIT28_19470 [Photobacterium proteolyticum]